MAPCQKLARTRRTLASFPACSFQLPTFSLSLCCISSDVGDAQRANSVRDYIQLYLGHCNPRAFFSFFHSCMHTTASALLSSTRRQTQEPPPSPPRINQRSNALHAHTCPWGQMGSSWPVRGTASRIARPPPPLMSKKIWQRYVRRCAYAAEQATLLILRSA